MLHLNQYRLTQRLQEPPRYFQSPTFRIQQILHLAKDPEGLFLIGVARLHDFRLKLRATYT